MRGGRKTGNLVKTILSPATNSAVATHQKDWQGKEMTKKKSGPIYHLQIVLNKLWGLTLVLKNSSLFPPHRTNTTKCLSTCTAECWQHFYQLKGSPLWRLIHGSCQRGCSEKGIIKMEEQKEAGQV